MNLRQSGHTYNDISGILGKSITSIRALMKPFKPKQRKKSKHILISAEEMQNLYHDKQMSGHQIALYLDVSKRQVFKFMSKNNIERRSLSAAAKLVSTGQTRARHVVLKGTGKITNIYFLYAPSINMVKIGRTSNIANRIKKIDEASPVPLRLLKTFTNVDAIEENRLHILFTEYRRKGEWFEVVGDLAVYLDEFINVKQVAM